MATVEVPGASSAEDVLCGYKVRDGVLVPKFGPHDPSTMKLALVGNWKMQCGISTYSENLWPEVARHVGEVKIFAEENDRPTGDVRQLGDLRLADDRVVQCWKRGQPLDRLVEELKAYDPDVIWIQHEFGLWPNARHWLSLMSRLSDFRVIVTMHSVFPNHRDKTICEAAMPEIVVHLEGARHCLKDDKQVGGNVHVIPHGCYPCTDRNRLWNFYRSEHTFLQFGFGFHYKGWRNSIETTAILKKKYPDVFFTGLFSESPFAKMDHQNYFVELMRAVEELGVQQNVALIRGFQSDAVIDSYIRTNRVTLFPYVSSPEHEVFGASGAARMAMSKAVPVVTSTVNHFSDLPTLKAGTPAEMAEVIDRLFSDPNEATKQVQTQLDFIEANSWQKVAARYLELFASPRQSQRTEPSDP
jgi:glycosyltransferase involved in cell wall biosynthesis